MAASTAGLDTARPTASTAAARTSALLFPRHARSRAGRSPRTGAAATAAA